MSQIKEKIKEVKKIILNKKNSNFILISNQSIHLIQKSNFLPKKSTKNIKYLENFKIFPIYIIKYNNIFELLKTNYNKAFLYKIKYYYCKNYKNFEKSKIFLNYTDILFCVNTNILLKKIVINCLII